MVSDREAFRQIRNAMSDLSLGKPTIDGVLDALQDLHRLRHLYPPLLAREQRAYGACEEIANHADGPLGHVVNVSKLSAALAEIARQGILPTKEPT